MSCQTTRVLLREHIVASTTTQQLPGLSKGSDWTKTEICRMTTPAPCSSHMNCWTALTALLVGTKWDGVLHP